MDGETLEVLPDEVQVRKSPKPGLAVAEDAGYLVAVTTELTDELRWEGYAREVVRNIQELRKKSRLRDQRPDRDDRAGRPRAGAGVARVRRRHRRATRCRPRFEQGAPAEGAFTASLKLDGEEVVVGVRKA